MGKTKRGKGTKLMALADRSGVPLAVHAARASPHEVTLVEATLAASFVGEEPKRLIGDRAYDSEVFWVRARKGTAALIAVLTR